MWNPLKREPDVISVLAELLTKKPMQEDLLGVSNIPNPTEQDISSDASRILQYSYSEDYKTFAKEAWARVLTEMDVVLSPKSNSDQIHTARGAIRATLDLLRLSYQARFTKDRMDQRKKQTAVPLR